MSPVIINTNETIQLPFIQSPCTGVCRYNTEKVCIGCGRTTEDISKWFMMTDEQKIHCKEKSAERLQNIKNKEEAGSTKEFKRKQ